MRGYGEYKEIGADYAPQIPSHWSTAQLREVFIERKEKNTGRRNDNILSVMKNIGVILYSQKGNVGNKCSEDIERYSVVHIDDIVINSMNVIIGSVGRSRYSGVLSPVYYVLKNRDTYKNNTRYFEFLFRMVELQRELTKYGKGILAHRMRIPMDSFKSLFFPFPPREEQDQIVRYLDAKVGKINKLIRIKQQQIALLKEKKQAIINQAVTKGLDPNAPMKDSGIAWIGQIPEGWEVTPLKKIATVQSGITLGKSYPANNVQNYPYMCVANVQNGFLDLSKVKNIQVPEHEASRHMLQKNDVLMTEGGDPDKLGRGCLWNGELEHCLHQNHIFAVRSDSTQISSEYLCLFLSSSLSQLYFLLTSKQTTNLASTNKTKLGSLPIPLPSIEVQKSILMELQNGLSRYEALVTACVHKITALTEYRTRLISDVVTGKVDVRNICIADNQPTVFEEEYGGEEADNATDLLECEE